VNIHIVASWTVKLYNSLGGYKLSKRAYVIYFKGSKFGLTCENNYFPHRVAISKAVCLYISEFLKPDPLPLLS
jgi:hypothetical protein